MRFKKFCAAFLKELNRLDHALSADPVATDWYVIGKIWFILSGTGTTFRVNTSAVSKMVNRHGKNSIVKDVPNFAWAVF